MNHRTTVIHLMTPARFVSIIALLLCAAALLYQPHRTVAHLMQSNDDGIVTHSVNGNTEIWRIDRPNVRQPMTPYPQIRFQPGDQVRVTAGGCVRTGPHGRPWKRYVDPIGPDSGPHFHGMVLIPGAFGSLPASIDSAVRILIAKGGTRTVAAITEPRKQHLWLGYEDDNYSDNDYNSPDEGVQGQCKVGDHLIGNAFVVVTIVHGAAPTQPRSQPFDLLLGGLDDNDILLNPKWATQDLRPDTNASFRVTGVSPSPTFPDPVGAPCDRRPYTRCTTQPTTSDNGILCGLTVADGHHNWAAATYTGRIFWNDHSCSVCDGDYNFRLVPKDGAGLTKSNRNVRATGERSMKLEFADDETIDHFHTPWWDSFRDAVDAGDDADPKVRATAMVNGQDAIVTGLLGLDCAHDCASELHPVWAMAIKVKDDPADETWAIFVRRWGNEGFCSRDQHYLDDLQGNEYTFRLPWRSNATSVSLTSNLFCRFGQAAGPSVNSVPKVGLLVSFFLPVPDSDDGEVIHGELHLQWTGSSSRTVLNPAFPSKLIGAPTLNAGAGDEGDEDEPEGRYARLLARMTADQRATFTAQFARKAVSFHEAPLRFVAPPRQLLALPARVPRPRRPTVRTAPDRRKQASDRLQLEALRRVFGNDLPGFSTTPQALEPLRPGRGRPVRKRGNVPE